ncbi:hypothetical protein ACM66B_003069 [Microbotryomycetes sp. NB124-2]
MLRLAQAIDWQRYSTRRYIISSGDTLSRQKALEMEQQIGSGSFEVFDIPRARQVHQSYLTSIFTTLWSLVVCLWLISIRPMLVARHERPRRFADVMLLNGPGSCVPIVVAAFLPRVFGLPATKLVYIESFARTKKLSMSAKLVRPFVDRFFVQWETLRQSLVGKEGDDKTEQHDSRNGRSGVSKGVGRVKWRLQAPVECQGWFV